jgi:hypothetical protein
MRKVLVVIESDGREIIESPTVSRMLSAIEMAIAEDTTQATSVQVVAVNNLTSIDQGVEFQHRNLERSSELQEIIYCPLTLCLPENLVVPFEGIIKACGDIPGLRQKLAQHIQVAVGDGCYWLPVVLTAYGPLYGEVITFKEDSNRQKLPDNLMLCDLTYYQPLHLSDVLRQSLYNMAHNLLQFLLAPPATYLVQFGLEESEICFDRLWPFPTAPALASLGVQEPDLFTCHWYCLKALPILDLNIIPVAQ